MRRSLLATPFAVAAVLLVGGCHHGGAEDVTPSAKPAEPTTNAAGAARDTAAAAAAGMHDTAAAAAAGMHDTAAAAGAGMKDTAAMKADSLGAKADTAMKRDSM